MRRKAYIILGKKKDGSYVGYVEHSFSMGSSDEVVRVDRVDKYFKLINHQKDVDRLNKETTDIKWTLYRIGTKRCPVKINWGNYHRLVKDGKIKKFSYRNLAFVVKK